MRTAIVSTALLLLAGTAAQAQIFDDDYARSDELRITADAGLFSDRIFRGQNLYNGVSFQPQVRADFDTGSGIVFGRWFSHFAGDQGDTRRSSTAPFDADDGGTQKVAPVDDSFNEYDFDLGYALVLDQVTATLGHQWYIYDQSNGRLRDTSEVYARLDVPAFLHARVLAAYEYDAREGWYYEAGVHEPFAVGGFSENTFIVPSVTVGFASGLDNGRYPIYDSSGLAFVDVGLKGQIPLSEAVILEPEVHYNEGIDDAATADLWFGMRLQTTLGM